MTVDSVSDIDYSKRMTGFTKLFSSLVYSTVWREEMHVKVVWITMLALADRNGFVPASLPGLADMARVTLEQCQDALERLSGPDPYSRTKLYDGRRVEAVDGGWLVLNYLKYRELASKDERRIANREAVARHRSKQKSPDVIASHQSKHIADAEAEAEAVKSLRSRAETTPDPASPWGMDKPPVSETPGAERKPGEGEGMAKADFLAAVRKAST